MKRDATNMLSELLNCGYADIEYIAELEESFDVDVDLRELLSEYGNLDANTVINVIFETALQNADFDWNESDNKVSIFTNCLDSHLSINNEEVYNFDELKEALSNKK